jgi:ketosteroid isomerase-like protein
MSRHADEATVRRWFDAFNSRDLEGMLSCMDAHVDFRPLRLRGIDSVYHCHVGIRVWFEDLTRMEHHHRVELTQICAHSEERVIAAGTLSGAGSGGSASFWAAENLENGRIVVAHHYSDRFPS